MQISISFFNHSTSITQKNVNICMREVIDMYKILIVEDEYHIRQIIKDYFSLKDI